MHLLIVEDDDRLRRLLKRLLEEQRHVVDTCATGEDGYAVASAGDAIDVVILDIGLPDISGLEVAKRLRRDKSQVAILMLTARDTVGDRVTGLDSGADDYLVKPFAFAELSARLRALGRRSSNGSRRPEARLRVGPIVLDETRRLVTISDQPVELSPREFSLLECFLRHPEQALTRDQLLDHAWPFGVAVTPNAVDAYVHYLRDKLGDAGAMSEPSEAWDIASAMPEDELLGWGDPLDDGSDTHLPGQPLRVGAAADEDVEQVRDARLVRGVRWRLVLFSGGATLLVLLLLGVAIYTAVSNSLVSQSVGQLDERAQPIVQWVKRGGAGPAPLELRFGGRTTGTIAVLVDDEDHVGGPAGLQLPSGLPDKASVAEARAHGRDVRDVDAGGYPARVLSVSASAPGGDEYVTQVVQDRTAEQETLGSLLQVLIGGGVLALVLASMLGAAYATRALVPIRASLHAQRVALRRQREFAADASHELRTPLTIVRSSVEDLRLHQDQPVAEVGTALDDIDAEVSHLTSLVEDLLLLARSDSGALDLTLQPVELGDVAADAATSMMSPAGARGVRIEVDPEPVMVTGDPLRLRQVVTILVDNAVRHSPAGGEVRVRVRGDRSVARLVVEDEGPGVRPEDLEHVFDRFWRAQNSPGGGTGLGLAIAATIVTRLGGRIGVADRPTGGAVFTVELPALAATSR